jgi:sarcosine oxidase, subunit beta
MMRESADIVVVGAGVNGASTAYQLARRGAGHIVVVERRHLAAGASGKSGGLVRMHYTNEPETRLAQRSLRYFREWPELVGGDCGFNPVGFLCMVPPESRAQLEANIAMQRALGVNTRIIAADEARELDPSLEPGDSILAYEADSGYADSNATTYAFAAAARRLGVEFRLETEVTAIRVAGERVTGVETTRGPIAAPVVVVAAGAWANHLFGPLGIDLGLTPALVQVAIFRWAPDRSPHHLTYIDHVHHSWIRPIDGTSTLLGAEFGLNHNHGDPNNFSESASHAYIQQCRELLIRRFPVMRHANARGNWACILMESPDSRPIIGALPPYEGLFTMAGDSGTSFKTAPAIGECLAELISEGRASTVDLTPFRATRFAEGKPWHDANDYDLVRPTISR